MENLDQVAQLGIFARLPWCWAWCGTSSGVVGWIGWFFKLILAWTRQKTRRTRRIRHLDLWGLILVFSVAFQTTYRAEPLASISRPFNLNLSFLNTTTQSSYKHKNNTLQYISLQPCFWTPQKSKTPRSLHIPCQPLKFSKHAPQTGPWVPRIRRSSSISSCCIYYLGQRRR